MTNDFKTGFSRGLGLTTGVLAIPVAGLLLFGVYRVLIGPVKGLLYSEEMYEYFDCFDKRMNNYVERNEAIIKGVEEPPETERCERPTRVWKWQPKIENK